MKERVLKRKQAAGGAGNVCQCVPSSPECGLFPTARGPRGSRVDRKDAADYRLLKAEGNRRLGSLGNREPVGSFEKGKEFDEKGHLARQIGQLSAG